MQFIAALKSYKNELSERALLDFKKRSSFQASKYSSRQTKYHQHTK